MSLEKKWNKYWKIEHSGDEEGGFEFTDNDNHKTSTRLLISQLIKQEGGTLKGKKILDLGSGSGYASEQLIGLGAKVTAVSISKKDEKHLKKIKGLKYWIGDMHDLPFKDSEFDIIYSRHSFEHSMAPYILACELNRVLKKKGHVMLIQPSFLWNSMQGHFQILIPIQMCYLFAKCGFVGDTFGKLDYKGPGAGDWEFLYSFKKDFNYDEEGYKQKPIQFFAKDCGDEEMRNMLMYSYTEVPKHTSDGIEVKNDENTKQRILQF